MSEVLKIVGRWLAPLGAGILLAALLLFCLPLAPAQDCDLAHKSKALRLTPATYVVESSPAINAPEQSALEPGVEAFTTARLTVNETAFGELALYEAQIGEELVTLAIVDKNHGTPTLKWIETVPDRRRQGYATELANGLMAHLGTPLIVDPSTETGKAWVESLAKTVAPLEPFAPELPAGPPATCTDATCADGSCSTACPDCGETHCPTCSEPASASHSVATRAGLVAGQPVRNAGRVLARVTGVGNGNRAAYFDGDGWRPGKLLRTLGHNVRARMEARQANRQARRAARGR
jgi:hypothetical protein